MIDVKFHYAPDYLPPSASAKPELSTGDNQGSKISLTNPEHHRMIRLIERIHSTNILFVGVLCTIACRPCLCRPYQGCPCQSQSYPCPCRRCRGFRRRPGPWPCPSRRRRRPCPCRRPCPLRASAARAPQSAPAAKRKLKVYTRS